MYLRKDLLCHAVSVSSTVVLALSLFAIDGVLAEDSEPRGQPPAMVSARLGEGELLTIQRVVIVPEQRTEIQKVTVTEFRTEIVGGKAVARPVTIEKGVPVVTTTFAEVVQEFEVTKEAYQIRDLAGKRLETRLSGKRWPRRSLCFLFRAKGARPVLCGVLQTGNSGGVSRRALGKSFPRRAAACGRRSETASPRNQATSRGSAAPQVSTTTAAAAGIMLAFVRWRAL